MRQVRQAIVSDFETQPAAGSGHRALVKTRTELEAKLLAYRCGWQKLDDIRVRKLERSLRIVLNELGSPDPAEALIRKRAR